LKKRSQLEQNSEKEKNNYLTKKKDKHILMNMILLKKSICSKTMIATCIQAYHRNKTNKKTREKKAPQITPT